MASLQISGALAESAGAAGPSATGFNKNLRFKGARLDSEAGDGLLIVYKGEDATGPVLCRLRTSDEKQSDEFLLPGDDAVVCPLGVFYASTNSGGTSVHTLYRVA